MKYVEAVLLVVAKIFRFCLNTWPHLSVFYRDYREELETTNSFVRTVWKCTEHVGKFSVVLKSAVQWIR